MERLEFDKGKYSAIEAAIHLNRYFIAKFCCKGKVVLDVACGEGYGSYLLSKWGAKEVVGVDISSTAISKAKKIFKLDNINFKTSNAEKMIHLPNSFFDLVVSFETIEHVNNPQKFLNEILRVAKKDATIIITCPNDYFYYSDGVSSNKYHLKKYKFKEFKDFTEQVLGDDVEYLLGIYVGGYINTKRCKRLLDQKQEYMLNFKNIDTLVVPPDTDIIEKNSCYYVGIWNGKTPNSAVIYPYSHNEIMNFQNQVIENIKFLQNQMIEFEKEKKNYEKKINEYKILFDIMEKENGLIKSDIIKSSSFYNRFYNKIKSILYSRDYKIFKVIRKILKFFFSSKKVKLKHKHNKLASEIKGLIYGFSTWHRLIGDVENIGENGKNLTIVVLSYNRISSTIKLMTSVEKVIPNFEGVFLIMDNGSFKKELNKLKNKIKDFSYKIELVELNNNYGVAGGRNRAIPYIKTDWFMSLDNDIYFISNPLIEIKATIMELGCKFLNLPLLDESREKIFANGGHIYINLVKNNILIGAGSLFEQAKYKKNDEFDSSLSTFLYGGSAVLNKATFIECGMFDDNMFIGFEDIDFSMSIFKKGYKIGNCGKVSLVHDHKIDYKTSDINYEKKRFSSKLLYKSALYFEKKHNMKVWSDAIEEWLEEKHSLMNSKNVIKKKKSKPTIALIVDVDNWAFSNISKQIMKYLNDYYNFKYFSMDKIDNIIELLFYVKDCDLIHFFWRGHLSLLNGYGVYQYLETFGCSDPKQYIHDLISSLNISTAVYDHLYLEDNAKMTREILKYAKNYYVSSNKLKKIYNNITSLKKPRLVVSDGVDFNMFYPKYLNRFDNIKKRKIIIGWVGNSKWSSETEDFKGVNTILKPAIDELIKEGYPVNMFYADKNEKMIPHDKMKNYYSKIDLYVCTSKIEGTPNPILESMACGIPIVSTDVGIVQDVFGKKQKQFILKERSINCLKKKIVYLIENPQMFKELSDENLFSIKKWSWKEKVKNFDTYFKLCLKK